MRRKHNNRTKTKARRQGGRKAKRRFVPPRTLEEFFAMPERDQEFWGNVGQVVTEVRAGASLRQASHKFDLDPRRVRQAARPSLRKLRNGRWVARSNDRLLRVLVIPTRKGLREIGVGDFRQAWDMQSWAQLQDLSIQVISMSIAQRLVFFLCCSFCFILVDFFASSS